MNDILIPNLVREMPKPGLPKPEPRLTVDEYLEMERAAEERHVYVDGRVWPIPFEGFAHACISVNLIVTVGTQLKGTLRCPFAKVMRIRVGDPLSSRKGVMFCYPDLFVVDGEAICADDRQDIVLNPKVIVEALSPPTEAFDRGEKFNRLGEHNPSLSDYLLVSQDKPRIEHFTRGSDGGWTYRRYKGLVAVVPVPSIGCELKLVDVYERVKFEDE